MWTLEQHAALVRMAADGLTGSEIAKALGVTRNAVMGRAHRTGVVLPMDERKTAICGAGWAATHSDPIIAARRKEAARLATQKLSDAQVETIRRRRGAGEKIAALAAEYGVCDSWISMIANGRRRQQKAA